MKNTKKTKSSSKNKNKTQKVLWGGFHSYKHKNKESSKMVKTFMETLVMVKLYHWKTHSYAEHKATDELYSKLNEHIDSFVEVFLGKSKKRINMIEKTMHLYDLNDQKSLKEHLFEFQQFLIDMNRVLNSKTDSDLLNIRDEILGDINQFLYLLSLH